MKEKQDTQSTNDLLKSFLKSEKENHYNFEEEVNWKVSSGSLNLDSVLGGGFPPGVNRFCGSSEAGKSSAALEVARNFLKMPNSRALYIKAEGRLGKEVRDRSGLTYVWTADEWTDGTVFVYESNIYESALDIINLFIRNNPEKKRIIFILDSVDGLIKKDDLDKALSDSMKVAGGAVIASNFLKRVSIPLAKRGHMFLPLSQVRAEIKLDPYAKTAQSLTSSTGGNALEHYPNWVLEFERGWNADKILRNEKEKFHPQNNPIVGHYARAIIRKSTNESTGTLVRYPIKHGRTGGTSIWVEREIVEQLLAWGLVFKDKNTFKFDEQFYIEQGLEELGIGPKAVGMANLYALFEGNEEATQKLYKFFLKHNEGLCNLDGSETEDSETQEVSGGLEGEKFIEVSTES